MWGWLDGVFDLEIVVFQCEAVVAVESERVPRFRGLEEDDVWGAVVELCGHRRSEDSDADAVVRVCGEGRFSPTLAEIVSSSDSCPVTHLLGTDVQINTLVIGGVYCVPDDSDCGSSSDSSVDPSGNSDVLFDNVDGVHVAWDCSPRDWPRMIRFYGVISVDELPSVAMSVVVWSVCGQQGSWRVCEGVPEE